MKISRRQKTVIFVAVGALCVASLGARYLSAPARVTYPPAQKEQPNIPALSPVAQSGELAFNTHCVLCHGDNAFGTEQGPPLVHMIYEPNHHGDQSFRLAAKQGVRAHHWRYGDMPPQPQVTGKDMTGIIAYVRELQRANGIGARANAMKMAPGK